MRTLPSCVRAFKRSSASRAPGGSPISGVLILPPHRVHDGDDQLDDPCRYCALDRVGCHPLVVEEVALGSIRQRDKVLSLLANLHQFPAVGHHEVLHITSQRKLWGRGLSPVDVHLMAAVALVPGAQLWTRNKRLKSACAEAGVHLFDQG